VVFVIFSGCQTTARLPFARQVFALDVSSRQPIHEMFAHVSRTNSLIASVDNSRV